MLTAGRLKLMFYLSFVNSSIAASYDFETIERALDLFVKTQRDLISSPLPHFYADRPVNHTITQEKVRLIEEV